MYREMAEVRLSWAAPAVVNLTNLAGLVLIRQVSQMENSLLETKQKKKFTLFYLFLLKLT